MQGILINSNLFFSLLVATYQTDFMTFGLKNAVLDQLDDQFLKWTLPQASGPAFLFMLNITLAIRSTLGVKGLMRKKEKRGSLTMKVVGK